MIMHFRVTVQRGDMAEYRYDGAKTVQQRTKAAAGRWSPWRVVASRNPEFSWPTYVANVQTDTDAKFEVISEGVITHA